MADWDRFRDFHPPEDKDGILFPPYFLRSGKGQLTTLLLNSMASSTWSAHSKAWSEWSAWLK